MGPEKEDFSRKGKMSPDTWKLFASGENLHDLYFLNFQPIISIRKLSIVDNL
jgi:hypothetical protein